MAEMQYEFMVLVLANDELRGYSGSPQSFNKRSQNKQTAFVGCLFVCISVRFDSIEPGVTHATWLKAYMFH